MPHLVVSRKLAEPALPQHLTKSMYCTDSSFAMGITHTPAILKQTVTKVWSFAYNWVDTVRQTTKSESKILQEQQQARAAKEAKIKEAKEKAAKWSKFSFFGTKKAQTENVPNVEEDCRG